MMILKKTWELVLDIFFPPICLSCKKYLREEEKPNLVCESCFKSIPIYKNLFYPSTQFALAAATPYENNTVRELIHYFKYESFMQAQKPLGEILTIYLKQFDLNLKDFVIVPIPLYPARKRERGFNQSEILAEIISKNFGCKLETNILKRVKETKSQIKIFDYEMRGKNVKDAFSANKELKDYIKDKQVLLIDDVYTSGATMNEAVKVLRKIGAKEVVRLVVAKTN